MSKETSKSREEVLAAREAKKLLKMKGKTKADTENIPTDPKQNEMVPEKTKDALKDKPHGDNTKKPLSNESVTEAPKDEVDKAVLDDKSREQIKTEREAKKAAKQARKKGTEDTKPDPPTKKEKEHKQEAKPDMTVKDVVETLKEIKIVAKEVEDITAKKPQKAQPKTVSDENKEETTKSKAELKAERRAKQEAQRAAKQGAQEKAMKEQTKPKAVPKVEDVIKEKSPKLKDKSKAIVKAASAQRVNWFQHLNTEQDKNTLKKITINSNLHPAIIKLGVQLQSRVVCGSNARCVALLDALKKMLKDYTLPAKTEFARGLEAHLATSLDFLWAMRQPSASQTNAVKYFRHHLKQLPNDIDEFDAKKTLSEAIDDYVLYQIDKAGEAISIAVRSKISTGDNILTYGCSSLIERILREAWAAGVRFRAVVVGDRVQGGSGGGGARDMLRRLAGAGLRCTYLDITAISSVMNTIDKVVLGAGALLANGSVLGAAGTAGVALVARAANVPVLVACHTHQVSERVQIDAFVYNEIGDPDDLIDKSDENSPLKDWRDNPNLTLLNLTYDVTPPSLVTAVFTEKAILPCTSAPVVLRTKLSEYGI